MPGLEFKGKQHIYAHHLTVAYRPLVADLGRSVNPVEADDNLIIHGDNLYALKALVPRFAGRVKCVYIDPPYNTGNEGWHYNDKVNSSLMREWLRQVGPVDGEDLERHDKWLCMMWPRLHLLRELLSEDGVIFVSIDDNEQHHLRLLMDEVFGPDNFVTDFIWNKKNVVQNDARFASVNHEYVVCYRKSDALVRFNSLPRTEQANLRYTNPDDDPRGPWQSVALQAKSGTTSSVYSVAFPNGVSWTPPSGTFPKFTEDRLIELYEQGYLYFGKSGRNVPRLKKYLSDVMPGMVSNSVLTTDEVGSTQRATETLSRIMGGNVFSSPKSVGLISRLVSLATGPNDIVLDSFAGSGTTAHAVLALNKSDGGRRKFILVECEDYADAITAERVRRVISGVAGARDVDLREGLGGSFTFCALGDPIDEEGMLTGEALPGFGALAGYLLYVSTGVSAGVELRALNDDGLFYSGDGRDYYLLYRADLEWLRSNEAMFNEERARRIAGLGRRAVMFAAGKYIGQRALTDLGIVFCQIPYEMHYPLRG